MTTQKNYDLPGAVAAAISTQRAELINLRINEIKQGQLLSPEHSVGILEAFRDLLQAHSDDHQRAQALGRRLKVINDATKGLEALQRQIRISLSKIGSNEPLSQDEVE